MGKSNNYYRRERVLAALLIGCLLLVWIPLAYLLSLSQILIQKLSFRSK